MLALSSLPLVCVLAGLAAPVDVAAAAEQPEPAAPATADAYSVERARADLEALVNGRGREYLEARARLEANAAVTAPLVLERISAVPAPGPAERGRLLALLGTFRRPEDLALFADQLRQLARRRDADLAGIELWRRLLREQGGAATPALSQLVADKEIHEDIRAQLLGDLVDAYPPERLAELVELLGRGQTLLRRELQRAVTKRTRTSPDDRARVAAALDQKLDSLTGPEGAKDPYHAAAVIQLRATLVDPKDPADATAVAQRFGTLAKNAGAGFALRVSAIRALVKLGSEQATAQTLLVELVRATVAPSAREAQANEILGWIALRGLSPARAQPLIREFQLLTATAPRLASAAYALSPAPAAGAWDAWLASSQEHPWPQVRSAALDRVDSPCEQAVSRFIGALADESKRGGDDESTVARAAMAALGRCEDETSRAQLESILRKHKLDQNWRGEAARQLVKHYGSEGADAVARSLDIEADLATALRFIRALGLSPEAATPAVQRALCTASETTELAAEARASLSRLFSGADARCS